MIRAKTIVFLLAISCLGGAYADDNMRGKEFGDDETKIGALKEAYWNLFEEGLRKIIGLRMADGAVRNCFKIDFEKNFKNFEDYYFKDVVKKCWQSAEQFECSVLASLDMQKLTVKTKKHARQCRIEAPIGSQDILIVRNYKNKLADLLGNNLQAKLRNAGHMVYLTEPGTPSAVREHNCNEIQQVLQERISREGDYDSSIMELQNKVDECKKSQNIDYVLKVNALSVIQEDYDVKRRLISGNIEYDVTIVNRQTGFRENSISKKYLKSDGRGNSDISAKKDLDDILIAKLVALINKRMNEIFIDSEKDLFKEGYRYTVIVQGLKKDNASRKKLRMVRDTLKKSYDTKPKRDDAASQSGESVYRIQVKQEVDLEDVLDELYNAAESKGYDGFKAEIDQNSAIVVKF